MSFKKSVPNVADQKLLKMENKPEDRDINAVFASFNSKVSEENPDCKISFGKNMFAVSKP